MGVVVTGLINSYQNRTKSHKKQKYQQSLKKQGLVIPSIIEVQSVFGNFKGILLIYCEKEYKVNII